MMECNGNNQTTQFIHNTPYNAEEERAKTLFINDYREYMDYGVPATEYGTLRELTEQLTAQECSWRCGL
jgi:hypothetical protein